MGSQARNTGIAVLAAAPLALTGCAGTGAPTSPPASATSATAPAVVRIVMPDIIGMTLEQALQVLSGAHYEDTVRAPGAEMDWNRDRPRERHSWPHVPVDQGPTETPNAPAPAAPGPVEVVPAPSRDYPESAVDVAVAGSLPRLAAGTSDAAAGEIVMLVCNTLDSGSSPADALRGTTHLARHVDDGSRMLWRWLVGETETAAWGLDRLWDFCGGW